MSGVRGGPVVQIDYCGNAAPRPPFGRVTASETLFGPAPAEALRQICRQLAVAPEDLRAAEFTPPNGRLALAARRERAWLPVAIVRTGFTCAGFNTALSALAAEGWRP